MPRVGQQGRPALKVKDGAHFYYFANSSDFAVDADVTLRGARRLELWDPHTGETRSVAAQSAVPSGRSVARLKLQLPPIHSVFVVATPPSS